MSRARVLVTAYACEPGVGSEPGAGWQWVRRIARRHDTWLITRENNVAAIERAARAEGLDQLRVVGFDLPRWARWWKRGPRGATLYFYLWQLGLVPLARRLEREARFDLVHHLTFVSSWAPSGLAFLGLPFVWGPVGRHPRVPDRFLRGAGLGVRAAELAREALIRGLEALDPLVELTRRRAARVLVVSEQALQRLPARHRAKAIRVGSVATEPLALPEDRFEREGPLRVLFAGRLVDLKGVRLAVEAFGRVASNVPDATLTLVGRGPLEGWVRERARQLGLTRRITLAGHLPHLEARRRMLSADVFLFPSFEGAGMVVLEAMVAGCAVICLDFGGPGEMVGEERGLRVPLARTPRETAAELARAVLRLHGDEPLRQRLARAGHAFVNREETWDARAGTIERVYGELLPAAPPPPERASLSASDPRHGPEPRELSAEPATLARSAARPRGLEETTRTTKG